MNYRKFAFLPLAALLACQPNQEEAGNATAENEPASAETTSADAWVPLLSGNDLSGKWHTYGQNTTDPAWQLEDSTLHLNPALNKEGEGGDLVTDQTFEDFDLKLEWKIAKDGNSGIIFYVNEDTAKYDQTWNTGLEMQVLDNNGHPDAKIHKHRAGDLYDLVASSSEPVKPAGEWNQVEIRSKDGQLDMYMNGTQVVSTTLWDDNWKKLVAGSKFASMPGFGTFKAGKIALQNHGDEVWYRNIMIKRL